MGKVSGYSLYSVQQKERTVENQLPDFYPPLPNEKYEVIYADPPWDYGGKTQIDPEGWSVGYCQFTRNILHELEENITTLKNKFLYDL